MFKHVTMWSKSVFFIVFLSLSGLALSVDTDGDGYSDDDELDWGSDPLDANSVPMGGLSLTLIKAFLDIRQEREDAAADAVIINGKLIAKYNIGANVCADKNLSLTCDPQEDIAVTDGDGVYSLNLTTPINQEFLLAEISSENTKDASGLKPDKSYALMAPGVIIGGSGSNNISVYTTILSSLLLGDPSIENSESTFNRVQRTLESSILMSSIIDEDFVAIDDANAQSASETFQATLKEVQVDLFDRTRSILQLANSDAFGLSINRSAYTFAVDLATQQAIYEYYLPESDNASRQFKVAEENSHRKSSKTSVDINQTASYAASDASGGNEEIHPMVDTLKNAVIVAGSGQVAKLSGGRCTYDSSEDYTQIDYLSFDNDSVTSTKFYLEGESWLQPCAGAPEDSDTYVLSASGWVMEQQFGSNGYRSENNCLIENEVPDHSIKRKYCATTRNYSGELISMVLPNVQFPSESDRFPSGSLAFDVTWTREVERVEIYTLFAGSNGALDISSDKSSLIDFLQYKVDRDKQGQDADFWWEKTTNLRIVSFDDVSKEGSALWYDTRKGAPQSQGSGSGDGWEVRPFKVKEVSGVPIAIFDRNGYSMVSFESPESFNEVPVLAYLSSADANGISAGVYRGVLEAPNIPSTHNVGREDLDRFTNLTFINAVFDSLGLPRLSAQN